MASPTTPVWRRLYVQVLFAIFLGIVLGTIQPDLAKALKPLGDGFVALIRMMIAPVVFCTIVHGVASMRDMARVGRIGAKALIYFEVVSTFALALGLIAGHLFRPGLGFSHVANIAMDPKVAAFAARAADHKLGLSDHLLAVIPGSFLGPLVNGDILQVLLVSILTGFALGRMGEAGVRVTEAIETAGKVVFRVIGIIVHAAPVGAFGAMAYTVGAFGVDALINLGALVAIFYGVAAFFVIVVLGAIARICGFSIFSYLSYVREELLIVLGTSSSETVLPNLIHKLERLGASNSVVGLVVPTGYSFNLDGTNIYMTLAILFLAQATGTELSWAQEASILGVAMLTSKGASGVSGAGFVTLAATLAIVPDIPIASVGILLGVDRLMSQCRSLTNFIGNGVATLAVAAWEGELDRDRLHRELLRGPGLAEDELEPA